MTNTIVSGFRHVGIIVRDMDESLYFYKHILGIAMLISLNLTFYLNTISCIAVMFLVLLHLILLSLIHMINSSIYIEHLMRKKLLV